MSPEFTTLQVEFFLPQTRVVGELVHHGARRRLVDLMNSAEGATIELRNAVVLGLHEDEDPNDRHFRSVQVLRSAILFAVPRGDITNLGNPGERIAKVPVASVFLYPGFRIWSQLYVLPGVTPTQVSLLGKSNFIAVTDVVANETAEKRERLRLPLAILNLSNALAFAAV